MKITFPVDFVTADKFSKDANVSSQLIMTDISAGLNTSSCLDQWKNLEMKFVLVAYKGVQVLKSRLI